VFHIFISTTVKWDNHLTDNINIAQGIRQGVKLSTLLYKRYNNTILNSLTISTLGAKFGDIGVTSPACADDIVLLGPSTEMQAMIDVVQYNTRRDLVKLNPGKLKSSVWRRKITAKALSTHWKDKK
jgi:hypothetical protein